MAEDSARDVDISHHIKSLIDDEHRLRRQLSDGEITAGDEHTQLGRIETELDQCWDLLRQRRAKREFGADPDDAEARPESVVEGYRQ
jgi:Protein of unknown function (DUF2630)